MGEGFRLSDPHHPKRHEHRDQLSSRRTPQCRRTCQDASPLATGQRATGNALSTHKRNQKRITRKLVLLLIMKKRTATSAHQGLAVCGPCFLCSFSRWIAKKDYRAQQLIRYLLWPQHILLNGLPIFGMFALDALAFGHRVPPHDGFATASIAPRFLTFCKVFRHGDRPPDEWLPLALFWYLTRAYVKCSGACVANCWDAFPISKTNPLQMLYSTGRRRMECLRTKRMYQRR